MDVLAYTIVIPTYNEINRLPWLLASLQSLSSVVASQGFVLEECLVIDGASTDGTPQLAENWSKGNLDFPLRVICENERMGKALSLNHIFESKLTTDIVVVMDADIRLGKDSQQALLSHFVNNSELAVVWGTALPDRQNLTCAASAFQMQLTRSFRQHLAADSVVSIGFFWAARISRLGSFRYNSEQLADDTQLSHYVNEHRLQCVQDPDCVIYLTPASSFKDFYLQTYRYYSALDSLNKGGPSSLNAARNSGLPISRMLRCALGLSIRNPLGAILYFIYLTSASVYHRYYGIQFEARWPVALTTKGK